MDISKHIAWVEKEDRKVNSFIALDKARTTDHGRAGNGFLKGLKIAVKSNLCVKGMICSCASKTLENYVSPYDAAAVERIKSCGAYIVGMANMDEFACGSSGETSYYGPTQNPAAPGRIPGGSSSGPAAAVAAGFADCALGTDTGGSIRNPASHCGITGFKPTYGVVSRYGLIDLAMSLDQVGPLAKDTATCAKLLEAIAGHDERMRHPSPSTENSMHSPGT